MFMGSHKGSGVKRCSRFPEYEFQLHYAIDRRQPVCQPDFSRYEFGDLNSVVMIGDIQQYCDRYKLCSWFSPPNCAALGRVDITG